MQMSAEIKRTVDSYRCCCC